MTLAEGEVRSSAACAQAAAGASSAAATTPRRTTRLRPRRLMSVSASHPRGRAHRPAAPAHRRRARRSRGPSCRRRRASRRASTLGCRVVGALRPVPVDERAVGVGLPDVERVRLRAGRARVEAEDRVLAGGDRAAGPRHLLDDRLFAGACRLHLLLPAVRCRLERIDREARGDGQLDLRRGRAFPSRSAPTR